MYRVLLIVGFFSNVIFSQVAPSDSKIKKAAELFGYKETGLQNWVDSSPENYFLIESAIHSHKKRKKIFYFIEGLGSMLLFSGIVLSNEKNQSETKGHLKEMFLVVPLILTGTSFMIGGLFTLSKSNEELLLEKKYFGLNVSIQFN